jgi:phosphoribosyl 1,2-cyclic phosphate phosphodiesterase
MAESDSDPPSYPCLEILGSGSSQGVPRPGCSCPCCCSSDPRDTRLRPSALLRVDPDSNIVFDCGPDFRQQAIRSGLVSLHTVLITHCHVDHLFGIEDLRPYGQVFMVSSPQWTNDIKDRFPELFGHALQVGGGIVRIDLRPVEGEFEIPISDEIRVPIVPVPILHGDIQCVGYRFGNCAYLTDCSAIPESSFGLLEGVELLVLDAVSLGGTRAHFSVAQALDVIARLNVRQAWLTHISHRDTHEAIQRAIDQAVSERPELRGKQIAPAFDRLIIEGIVL